MKILSLFKKKKSINIDQVEQLLITTAQKLNTIERINSGGCAIAILALFKYLNKNNYLKNNDIKFVYRYEHFNLVYDTNSEILNNNRLDKTPGSCSHALLYFNGKYIDSNGIRTLESLEWTPLETKFNNVEFLIKSINNIDSWNILFNRTSAIPQIEQLLDIDLNEIVR